MDWRILVNFIPRLLINRKKEVMLELKIKDFIYDSLTFVLITYIFVDLYIVINYVTLCSAMT
jgi:hypothetical protein